MSLATRLDKLLPALGVKERLRLILRAQAAGEEWDPDLKRLGTLDDRREYDRYAALIIAANNELGQVARALQVVMLSIESLLDHADLLLEAATQAAELEGTEMPALPVRNWRRRESFTVPVLLGGLAEEMRAEAQSHVELRWQEVRALQVVWDEVAAHFDGADPRHPELVEEADDVAANCEALLRRSWLRPKRLPEPTEEQLDDIRARVERAFEYFGLRATRE